MKKYILLIGFIILFIIPKPKYTECDNIKIIDSLSINCDYKITSSFHEVISKREDNSVKFYYKNHFYTNNNLYELKKEIEKNNLYIKGINKVITNCQNIDELSYLLNINKNKIKRK